MIPRWLAVGDRRVVVALIAVLIWFGAGLVQAQTPASSTPAVGTIKVPMATATHAIASGPRDAADPAVTVPAVVASPAAEPLAPIVFPTVTPTAPASYVVPITGNTVTFAPLARFHGDPVIRLPDVLHAGLFNRGHDVELRRYATQARQQQVTPIVTTGLPNRMQDNVLTMRLRAVMLGVLDRPARARLTQRLLGRVFAHLEVRERREFTRLFGSLNAPVWDIHERARVRFLEQGHTASAYIAALHGLASTTPLTPCGDILAEASGSVALANLYGLAFPAEGEAAALAEALGSAAATPEAQALMAAYREAVPWHLEAVKFLCCARWLDGESLLGRWQRQWLARQVVLEEPAFAPALDATRLLTGVPTLPGAIRQRWIAIDGRPFSGDLTTVARLLARGTLPTGGDRMRLPGFDGDLLGWNLRGWAGELLVPQDTLFVAPGLPLWAVYDLVPEGLSTLLLSRWAEVDRSWRRLGSGWVLVHDPLVHGVLTQLVVDELMPNQVELFPEMALGGLERWALHGRLAERSPFWVGRQLVPILQSQKVKPGKLREAIRLYPDSAHYCLGFAYRGDPRAPVRRLRLQPRLSWEALPGLRVKVSADGLQPTSIARELDLPFFEGALKYRDQRRLGIETK